MARILVIGSVARDEVVYLDAPLRTGTHNQGRLVGVRIGGGAANTAMALARAGDHAELVSAVGRDEDGDCLLHELGEVGVDVSLVSRTAAATTRSMVFLEGSGERTIINLARAYVPLPADLAQRPGDCLYVRSADPALMGVMEQRAHRSIVVAHVPPVRAACLPAQILIGSAGDLDVDFLADPWDAGRCVAGDLLQWMVVTHGSRGATAYGAGGQLSVQAPRVPVVDTTGAGDVFAAGLVHALVRGEAMQAALTTAVSWGATSVSYAGSVPPWGFPHCA